VNPRSFGRYDYITYLNFAGAQKNDNLTWIFKSTDCCSLTTGYIAHTCNAATYLDHRRWLQDIFWQCDNITYLNFAGAQKNDIFTVIFKSTDCCSWTTGYIGHTCNADTYFDHRRWLQDVFDDTITSLTFILLVIKKSTISHWYSNLLTAAAEPQVILVIHAILIFFLSLAVNSRRFGRYYLSRTFTEISKKKLIYCFSWTEVVWAVINARP